MATHRTWPTEHVLLAERHNILSIDIILRIPLKASETYKQDINAKK